MSPPPRPNPPSSGKPRTRRPPPPGMGGNWIFLVGLGLIVTLFIVLGTFANLGAVDYSDFLRIVENPELNKHLTKVVIVGQERIVGEVDDPVAMPEEIRGKLSGKSFVTLKPPLEDPELMKQLRQLTHRKDNPLKLVRQEEHFAWLGTLLMMLLPALLLLGLFLFLLPRLRDPMGGGFLNNYIKSPARRYEKTKGRVTFDDVADMEHAKRELQEVVEFLRTPEKFQRLGAQVPKGVLLVGPPGTGKTLLSRAVAGEAGVPFYSISGSEFIQMFVGVGASRVRDLFKTAKENSPCLLFIDEIDAVGRMRGAGVGGGSDEREQTLNQILSEMDGFQPTESVIVLAATNRPDVLDSALLRPGRFDRHVTIDRPTWQGRLAILKVHTRTKPLADDVNLEEIARAMFGMTGADLRNLTNEAALLATREGKSKIDRSDFNRAADRVLIGPKREEIFSAEEKRRTAYHEAGHTLCALFTPGADPVHKVTIIPRGRTGGVTQFRPDEDRVDHTRTQLMARLITIMGGRAADRLINKEPMSGAYGDLKQGTQIARMMVTHFGMSDRLGPVAFRVGEEHVFLGKEIHEPRDFSEGTAQIIDEEVQRILREADERAYELLEKHRVELDRLVEALLVREELLQDEITPIIEGREPAGGPAQPGASPAAVPK